jgi:hypothetical protein
MSYDWSGFLAGWAAGLSAAGLRDVDVSLLGSDNSHPKASWSVMVTAPTNAGQITVWDTGEAELGVYTTESSEAVVVQSTDVQDEADLASLLERFLSLCLGLK